MLPSLTMSRLVERLSALSQWTDGGSQVIAIIIVVVVVVVILAALLCHIRCRRCLDEEGRVPCSPPVYISSSSTTSPDGGGVDSWLRTVTEWAWSRSHVTWRHVAHCVVEAWMTALTEQASRQSVCAELALRTRLYSGSSGT